MTDEEIGQAAYEAIERRELETAKRLLLPLAEKGFTYALLNLAWIHQYGDGQLQDKQLAKAYYEKAIAAGDVAAYLGLGTLYSNEQKFAEARSMFEKGHALGGADFDIALDALERTEAEFRARSAIKQEEYKKAFQALLPYKTHDSEFTLIYLGWLYCTGAGGETDEALGYELYRRAAELGIARAYYLMGLVNIRKEDEVAARTFFLQGATAGHLPCMSKLGEMMVEGRGGPMDADEGIKHLSHAAKKGHVASKLKLVRVKIRLTDNVLKEIGYSFEYFFVLKDLFHSLLKGKIVEILYDFSRVDESTSKLKSFDMMLIETL